MRPKNATEELMLFHDVHRAHQNAILAALAERGVQDVGQPKALFVLSTLQNGCATQRELADMIHVSAATMANSLKRLERNGYIQRQSDEKDSRCNRIVITQKGLEAVERCQDAFDYVDTRLYAGFTPEEVERLKNAFRRMLQNMYAVGGARDTRCPPPPPDM